MTPAQREKVFGLFTAGWSLRKVAREMGVTKSAISKLRQKGVTLGEEVATKGDWGKGGRKKLFSEEESKWVKNKVQRIVFLKFHLISHKYSILKLETK